MIDSKKNDILDFIRVAVLRPEQINSVLPYLIESMVGDRKEEFDLKEVKQRAIDQILSDAHLEPFVGVIDRLFSQDEIKRLIEFYNDPSIKKYFENGALIGPPIYGSFQQVVSGIFAKSS